MRCVYGITAIFQILMALYWGARVLGLLKGSLSIGRCLALFIVCVVGGGISVGHL